MMVWRKNADARNTLAKKKDTASVARPVQPRGSLLWSRRRVSALAVAESRHGCARDGLLPLPVADITTMFLESKRWYNT